MKNITLKKADVFVPYAAKRKIDALDRAKERIRKSKIEDEGFRTRIALDTFAETRFYVSDALGVAYAVIKVRDTRYVYRTNLRTRVAEIEPLRTDVHGADLLAFYDNFLTALNFREVDATTFLHPRFATGITRGLGVTTRGK